MTFSHCSCQLAEVHLSEHIQPRLTDGPDADAATSFTVHLPTQKIDAMASTAAVKVWTVLATLAFLKVLQASPSPSDTDNGPCFERQSQCLKCFPIAESRNIQTECRLEWHFKVNGTTCKSPITKAICNTGNPPYGDFDACMRKCTYVTFLQIRNNRGSFTIKINSTF